MFLLRKIIIRLSLASILGNKDGLNGVWASLPIAEWASVVVSVILVIRLFRKTISKLEPTVA